MSSRFERNVGYEGWKKSIYEQVWFDSNPEGQAAVTLDQADEVRLWLRLHNGDLPILWTDDREYNPDFIAIEEGGTHYLIEIKGERDRDSVDVAKKREAAKRWANYVNADSRVQNRWAYLFLWESDVATAKGSWDALKRLGS